MRRIRALFSAEGKKPLLVKRRPKLCPFIPGCCSCRRKSLARESVFQRLSGQWPKWREFILNQTMKRPCFFAEHGSGGGKTAAILAEFSSENHLLAPLWFALKSRLLRQPPPSLRLAGRCLSRRKILFRLTRPFPVRPGSCGGGHAIVKHRRD